MWKRVAVLMIGLMLSAALLLMFERRQEESMSWSKLRSMSQEGWVQEPVIIEGYLVSEWINPEGDKKNTACWNSIVERNPVLYSESDYLALSLGFDIVPSEVNISKVRIRGYYSNEINGFKPTNNLGFLSKIDSIQFLEVSGAEREKMVDIYMKMEQANTAQPGDE
jgi:hypothetical protein